MEPAILLWLMAGFLAIDVGFESILDWLNLRHIKKGFPREVREFYSQEELEKARKYLQVNTRFSGTLATLSFLVTLVLLFSGFFGQFDLWLQGQVGPGLLSFLLFFFLLSSVSSLFKLPFEWYQVFRIESRFGFNTMTLKTFFSDKIKGLVLSILIGGPILWLIFFLANKLNATFWLPLWGAAVCIMLFFQFFYTSLILPLFNKLIPLDHGSLWEQIREVSAKAKFPFSQVLTMDGSKRSKKANAFFSGFGSKKKIVLFDTLLDQLDEKETVAVLAHEIGHYKLKHIWQGMSFSIIQTGVMLFLLSWFLFNPEPSIALGGNESRLSLNLVAFGLLFSPLSSLLSLAGNLISRKNEYQADAFARNLGFGTELGGALKKLSSKNLSNPNPHPAYVFWHYSHPTTLQRLTSLRQPTRGQ